MTEPRNTYSTERATLVPHVMLLRWSDDLVLYRRLHAEGRVETADERLVKVIREMRELADFAPPAQGL